MTQAPTHVIYGLKPRPDNSGLVDIMLSYTQRMLILYYHKHGDGEYDYEKIKQAPEEDEKFRKQFGSSLVEHIKLLTRDGIIIDEPIIGSEHKVRKRLTQLGHNLAVQIAKRHGDIVRFEMACAEDIEIDGKV